MSGRIFLLKLRSLQSDDETVRTCAVLKKLGQWGFRCISVTEEPQDDRTSTPTPGGTAGPV